MSGLGSAIGYDVATALWQGARPYQEDTLLADFHGGMDRGFAILADGMGGHAAGDLASRLVVIDAASHLKFLMHDGEALEKSLASELTSAIETANDVLKDRAADDRRLHGMGSTFLATVLFEDRLYWASVGDSPLYLWREGELRQLNEDHSMAPVIDQMARSGEITQADAANHPDRNALTSVLMGDTLKTMDVPETATVLDPGDVLIQASDGLQYLDEEQISRVLARGGSSRRIADALMAALRDLNDPGQDNAAILVLQLTQSRSVAAPAVTAASSDATERAVGSNRAADTASPRAPTPTDTARPAGARRWVVPAGLLGSTAVAAGLVFGLPGLQSGPDTATTTFETTTFEMAGLGEADARKPVPQPAADPIAPTDPTAAAALVAPAVPAAPSAPAVAPTRSITPAPGSTAEASAADALEIIEGTTPVTAGILAAEPEQVVDDKLATSVHTQSPAVASGATIEFGNAATSGAQAPGANAIGIGELATPPEQSDAAPQSEGISAPDTVQDPQAPVPAPQSQRTPQTGDGGVSRGQ